MVIRKAHTYANENNLPVRAKDGAVYYIGDTKGEAISVKTSTDWGNTQFIIDDKGVEYTQADIFRVESTLNSYSLELSSLTKGQTNIGMTLDSDCMVYLMDNETLRYKKTNSDGAPREGSCSPQQDAIYVYAAAEQYF